MEKGESNDNNNSDSAKWLYKDDASEVIIFKLLFLFFLDFFDTLISTYTYVHTENAP